MSSISLAMLSNTIVLTLWCLHFAVAVDPTVQLSYATYKGTALPNGITQWLGLRYAAPPIGDLRFCAPRDPTTENSTLIEADSHGPYCLGTGSGPPSNVSAEDCLFLDVYSPSNATNSSLPVYFFIQGGGFNTNSNPNLKFVAPSPCKESV